MTTDTIFALSSGRPPAAIAVVRISGPRARHALEALTGRVPEPRRAALARVRDPASGEILDEALALFFPGPNSETGEDTAELQLHGGRAVISGVLEALGRLEGLRPAEAGEFTRRAFENGQLDLTEVEGLADLIHADTAAQRRQAFRHLKGFLGERAETWRTRLIQALALIEAGIDFSDEADVPGDLIRPALKIARELHDEISAALVGTARGERLRDGLVVAIAGPPNAGKSTLLNRIARREAAIVSPHAGTTRDVIEVHLDLEGYPVTLLDTAGIRDSDDPVEQEGVRRARARAAEADLVLWVVDAAEVADEVSAELSDAAGLPRPDDAAARDATSPTARAEAPSRPEAPATCTGALYNAGLSPALGGLSVSLGDERPGSELEQAPRALTPALRPRDAAPGGGAPVAGARDPVLGSPEMGSPEMGTPEMWLIKNKIDLAKSNQRSSTRYHESEFMFSHRLSVSAVRGGGLNELLSRLGQYCENYFGSGEPALVARARHRSILIEVRDSLARALQQDISQREDIVAEELRLAARGLGRLTGRVDVEDILDVVFRDFCIGK
jgi:tRNA modification GTPase